ncbi:MAG: hypothetical protein AAGA56_16450 [Myxococcota bacterium]
MDRSEFERAFQALLRQHERDSDNPRSIACEDCAGCRDCTFCRRGQALTSCHYCIDAKNCVDCVHCRDSSDLTACNHCQASHRCSNCAYLEQCFECHNCTYCFGCVGLAGAEFHILNEPQERQTYFKRVAELSRLLR